MPSIRRKRARATRRSARSLHWFLQLELGLFSVVSISASATLFWFVAQSS